MIDTKLETKEKPLATKKQAANKGEASTTEAQEPFFFKAQLILSDTYQAFRDSLAVILKDDQPYSLAQVDQLLAQFMKGQVK